MLPEMDGVRDGSYPLRPFTVSCVKPGADCPKEALVAILGFSDRSMGPNVQYLVDWSRRVRINLLRETELCAGIRFYTKLGLELNHSELETPVYASVT